MSDSVFPVVTPSKSDGSLVSAFTMRELNRMLQYMLLRALLPLTAGVV